MRKRIKSFKSDREDKAKKIQAYNDMVKACYESNRMNAEADKNKLKKLN